MDESRRRILQVLASLPVLAAMPSPVFAAAGAAHYFAYVGCRTTKERNARGKGISVYRVEPSGEWKHVQLVGDLVNPSFLAMDRTQKYLYAIHGDFSEVSSFAIDPASGKLTFLNRQSTEGKNPVHLVPDPSNRYMVIANYATGTLVTLPILSDGKLGSVVDKVALPGEPGPHKTQQGSSHPHDVPYDRQNRFIIVPDKGLDRVFAFSVDANSGKLIAANPPSVRAREGAGTRHVDFHPNKPFAYVINELDSTITVYRYNAETAEMKPLQIVPTIPQDFTGDNTAAEIAVARSGRFLFGSNRGHDSIVSMAIDEQTGLLKPLAWTSSQGKGPRFFALDPADENLYAANENSDTIVGFKVNPETGLLSPNGLKLETGSPVCIVFRETSTGVGAKS